jgi:homoserine dehydrogenase
LLGILHEKKDFLRDTFGFEAKVVAITDKIKGTLIAPEGIDIPAVLALLGQGKGLAEYPKATPAQVEPLDPLDMIERTDADIIAEMTYTDIKTGEPATSYIKKALLRGKHVVTSNKGPAALHYRDIQDLARKNGIQFRIEGTVMSGTPVFHLAECGLAGNTVREVKGILNGTTNFILTKMETEGMDYRLSPEAAPVRPAGRGHGRPQRPQPGDRPDGQDHHPGGRRRQGRDGLRHPLGHPGHSPLLKTYRGLTRAPRSLYARGAVPTVSCRLS